MELIGVTIRVGLLTTDDQISPTMETQQYIHISTLYHDEKVLQFSYNPNLGESWIKFVDDSLYGSLILMKYIEWQYESVGLLTTVERMLSFTQQAPIHTHIYIVTWRKDSAVFVKFWASRGWYLLDESMTSIRWFDFNRIYRVTKRIGLLIFPKVKIIVESMIKIYVRT